MAKMRTIAIILTSILFFGLTFFGAFDKPVAYTQRTVSYTVKNGDTGHEIAYKFMGKQDKYDDVREFWFYISKDSNLDRQVPLQVGQELTINLYTSRR